MSVPGVHERLPRKSAGLFEEELQEGHGLDGGQPLPSSSDAFRPEVPVKLLHLGRRDSGVNVEEDALPWLLSFINCEKYPPSLLYLAMTLGIALLMRVVAERARGAVAGWFVTLGRVPMLFYVAHIALVHLVTIAYALAVDGDAGWLFGGLPPMNKPAGFGLSLPLVYAAWLVILVALYPLCRWFAALKRRRSDWWLSYL